METSNVIYGFDYGHDQKNNIVNFAGLEVGDVIDITVRDQFGSQTNCKEENFRRITGQVIEVTELEEGSPDVIGVWEIITTDVPMDFKKIRRRTEEYLRKHASNAELADIAIRCNIPLI